MRGLRFPHPKPPLVTFIYSKLTDEGEGGGGGRGGMGGCRSKCFSREIRNV